MLKVASIMSRIPVTVPPECPVSSALDLLREHKLRHVLVAEHGRLVGILSERDLMERPEPRRPATAGAEPLIEVRDRMSVSVETVAPDEGASEACRRLVDRRIGCLPVVDEGRLAGVLSESDFLRLYVRVQRFGGADPATDPRVEAVMSREVVVVDAGETAAAAFELCRAKGIRHLPVVSDGWLVGIASDRDLLPAVAQGEGDMRRVGDLMTMEYTAVAAEAPLSQAAERMVEKGFHALPVLAHGALRGIVTSADVLQALCALDQQVLEWAWSGEQALSANRTEE